MNEEKGERTTGGLPKYGQTEVIFNFLLSILLHIGQTFFSFAFGFYLVF
jgi:hypothetical protein